ncbi:hypothetical protein BN1048_02227 [Jeotgalicoccus saudimassiliensis]|uniref:Uncharacterized protein n=1 Tax=Jeotgalicoccus saudimassiliensis TaxID=1461582 RepID=A0A078M8S7_9STAP|nr:hypothetical protein [Jeotgalicoccus saudimassiliensis]CEA03838.1 hypothetical protein BN1048_02227 [Jeotgalicoccus saudimassiliensis]
MKKALVIILFLLFAAGIYFNFMHTGPIFTDEAAENTANDDTEVTEDGQQESDDTAQEDSAQEESADDSNGLAFNEPVIQEKYDERVSSNEQLIVDVLLPAHYSGNFAERLSEQTGSNTVQFNQIELPVNTTDMNELTVNGNSDVVIMDALQIADYNDEVLPERNLNNLTGAYMELYNADKTVILLGNPNAHEHENLAAELETDAEFFTENDYFYIDNQDTLTENPYDYDSGQLNPALEDEMISNITNYLFQ